MQRSISKDSCRHVKTLNGYCNGKKGGIQVSMMLNGFLGILTPTKSVTFVILKLPISMFEEKNSGSNLPAQIDIYSKTGAAYEFCFSQVEDLPIKPICTNKRSLY
jgi:hypothetical protein